MGEGSEKGTSLQPGFQATSGMTASAELLSQLIDKKTSAPSLHLTSSHGNIISFETFVTFTSLVFKLVDIAAQLVKVGKVPLRKSGF